MPFYLLSIFNLIFALNYMALSTFPLLRQREHTRILFGEPLTTALTLLKFGVQVLLL